MYAKLYIFSPFSNYDDYALELKKNPTSKPEYCEKVKYFRLKVPLYYELINSNHLQRVPEPLNGLSNSGGLTGWT